MRETSLRTTTRCREGFEGTFAVPMAEEGDFRFGYSEAVHTQLESGNLLLDGHPYYFVQAEVALPDVLDGREGFRVGPWVDYTQGLLPDGWAGGEAYLLGGMLASDDRLVFTKHQWYNGSGSDWQTQGYYQGPLDGSGTANGMWAVDGALAHHSRVGGYLSPAPASILADGWDFLAGLGGTSGAALGRWGPNLFAIESTPSDGKLPSAPLICHDTEIHQPPGWWIANKATSGLWVEIGDLHGVVFLVYRGLGATWYGLEDAGPGLPDPYGGGYGYHAEGWVFEVWIYDPDDLLQVYLGSRDPWSLTPVEQVELTRRDPGSSAEEHHSVFSGMAKANFKMSLRGRRLLILEPNAYPENEWEATPLGYVFDLGGSIFADGFEDGTTDAWTGSLDRRRPSSFFPAGKRDSALWRKCSAEGRIQMRWGPCRIPIAITTSAASSPGCPGSISRRRSPGTCTRRACPRTARRCGSC